MLAARLLAQDDGFISLMPAHDITEQWIAEVALASIWSVRKGVTLRWRHLLAVGGLACAIS